MMTGTHKLLVVDDDEIMHDLIQSALANSGRFHFLHAYNGEEGVRVYQEHKPSIMLLDIDMPGMNGLQVLNHLDFKNNVECPVIVLSGTPSPRDQEQCFELGAQLFIGKPFRVMALIDSVNFFLAQGDMPE